MATENPSRRTAKHKVNKGSRSTKREEGGILPPDKQKFENEIAEITKKIKELEAKTKPVSSNATQLIAAEITKETGALSEIEKTKEANTIRVKAIEAKIREVGAKYNEKKRVASDYLAGVRHKSESRHDNAVERLEQQLLIRRCSSSEERRFRQEIEALQKSKERLIEYLAAKGEVDQLKEEQERLRSERDSLHKKTREIRGKEMSSKDCIANLRQELEEAKERKKVSMAERDEIKKKIDMLYKQRKQLYDQFRSEQLAFLAASNEQIKQQRVEEQQRKDEIRAAREAKKKYRAIEQTFQIENQYLEYKTICNALIAHLQRLTITPNHTGAIPDLDEDVSPSTSATNLDPAPLRSESAPMIKPGEFLRREKDDVLVPSRTTLTRKRSKKEKRITIKVSKRLNLNATIFEQFSSLAVIPPSTLSDVPLVLSHLKEKLAYFEQMTKVELTPASLSKLETGDSGVGSSTAPSELMDVIDRDDFTNSQEEMNLDPGLGSSTSMTSPKRSHSEVITNGVSKLTDLPQRSSTDTITAEDDSRTDRLSSVSQELLAPRQGSDGDIPHVLVSMVSNSTGVSENSVTVGVGGSEE